MAIIRNPDGFSALPVADPLAALDIGNPRKWAVFFDDFLAYDITQVVGSPYTLTATNCVDTIAGPTGALVLTLGGADNDAGQLQVTGSGFQTNAKRLFFEIKLKLTLATGTIAANEIYVGLGKEQTTTSFINSGGTALAVDDFIGFAKYDTQTKFNAVQRASDVESVDVGVTPVLLDGVYVTLTVFYDGTRSYFYQDGKLVSTLQGNEPTAIISPVIYIKAGEAKANVLSVDYILAAVER